MPWIGFPHKETDTRILVQVIYLMVCPLNMVWEWVSKGCDFKPVISVGSWSSVLLGILGDIWSYPNWGAKKVEDLSKPIWFIITESCFGDINFPTLLAFLLLWPEWSPQAESVSRLQGIQKWSHWVVVAGVKCATERINEGTSAHKHMHIGPYCCWPTMSSWSTNMLSAFSVQAHPASLSRCLQVTSLSLSMFTISQFSLICKFN